jgi:hypothetical protein
MNSLKIHQKVSTSAFSYILVAMLVLTVLMTGSIMAGGESREVKLSLAVTHGPITMILADADSNGHQLADLRAGSIQTFDEHGQNTGRLDAMLTTTGIDIPKLNDESRISTLIFSFGDGVDQIVVNGSGLYPAAGGTLDLNSTVIRPVTGGTGDFAGANGWAESKHFEDGTWRHSFYLLEYKQH